VTRQPGGDDWADRRVLPLVSPQRLVGALTLARREVEPFTSIEQAVMQIIPNQAAISIDRQAKR